MRRGHAKGGAAPGRGRRARAALAALAAVAGAREAAAQRAPGRPPQPGAAISSPGLPPQPGAAISSPSPAAPPRHRVLYRSTTVGRVNPLGLFEELRLGYRRRLFDSESPLLRDAFVGAGLAAVGSPAVASLAPTIELQPLSVLQLTASYTGSVYFGTFGHLQSFPSAASPHGEDERERRDDAGLAYSSTRGQLTLQPLVQMKVGPIAARSAMRFVYNRARLRGDDRASYDPVFDLLVPRRGWVVANDSDLVAVAPWGLTAGARYSVVHALHGADDFAPGEPRQAANRTIQRVGPLVSYTFFDRPGAAFNTPTVIVLAQWWLDHAYRTGQDVSRALPYLIVGCSFSGDLL